MNDLPIPAELAIPDGEAPPPSDEEIDRYLYAANVGTEYEHMAGRVATFRLDNDGHAEFYMRRMAETGRELRELRAQADEWRAQIDAWLSRATGPIEARRAWWEAHLTDYAVRRRIARLAADPKDSRAKTLDLPSGRVSTTERKAVAKISDPAAVLAWLDAKADAEHLDPATTGWVVTERKPVAAEVKKLVILKGDDEDGYRAICDGEVVPGITVDGTTVTAEVRPS